MGILDRLSSGPAQVNAVSAFVIQEVLPLGVWKGSSRKLTLQGRGLPQRPLTLTTSQRLTLTWLPGYSVATAQALGAKEEITTIHGKWSDKFLSTNADTAANLGPIGSVFNAADQAIGAVGSAVGLGSSSLGGATNESTPVLWGDSRVERAKDACDHVDELVRGAVFVQVVWGSEARRGYITKFTKDWHNAHDVEWDMEFTWTSRTEASQPVTAAELSLGDTASLFQGLADALGTDALPPTFPMSNDVLRDVTADITRIATTTQAISDTVTNVTTLALAPFNTARAVMALADTLRGQCDALILRLNLTPPSGLSFTTASTDPQDAAQSSARPAAVRAESSATAPQHMVAAEYVKRVTTSANAIRSQAIITKDDFSRKLDRQVLAVVTMREGDDLRDVAARYYGSQADWKRIAQANGLTTAKMSAGMSVVIPIANNAEGC